MASELTAAFDESRRRKGEKNETGELWALSEPVRRLMYSRADVGGVSWVGGQCGGGVAGLAEVSWEKGHTGEEKEEEMERSRHVSYVMIIPKHRGRLFSTLPGQGSGAGVSEQVCRAGSKPGRRGTEGVEEARKDKLQKKKSKRQMGGPDDVMATGGRMTKVKIGWGSSGAGPLEAAPVIVISRTVRYRAQSAEDRMPPSIRLYG